MFYLFMSYLIILLQSSFDYENMQYVIRISKYLTKTKSYYIYFGILCYCNYVILPRVLLTFYISRYINTKIKYKIKQKRPYNDFPELIKYYKKRKDSYSFPSQSTQSIYIIYYSYNTSCSYYFIDLYFWSILVLLMFTRLYRGLHYLHDMLFSLLFANVMCMLII